MPKALILAGSRGVPDPVAVAAGVPHKALVDVGGQTMLARVAAALRAAGVEDISVSTSSQPVLDALVPLGLTPLGAAAGPSGSVALALGTLGTPLLVTTADHALLRPEWVRDFVSDMPADADVGVLLARRDKVEAALPGTRRTWLRFADGHWSGCNLFYLAGPEASSAVRLWQQVEADRKKPWKIARRLGLRTLLLYALGRLGLDQALRRLGAKAGVRATLVAARDGLAAVDVDSPADLEQVRALVASSRP